MPGAGEIIVDGYSYFDINEAQKKIKKNSTIYIGPGIYTQGMKIGYDNVTIIGNNTHFKGAVINGKASFVITSDNVTIESVECSNVEVKSKNGACIRHEGGKLTLSNVHFHDSEQGLLQGGEKGGEIYIKFSLFENLGKNGLAHGVYTNGRLLDIRDSSFRSIKDQGHAIKSRSNITILDHVIIDSAKGNDSRAVDVSDGGELYISNSVIYQGENTVNGQIIAYALESLGRQRNYIIELSNSIIIGERPNGNKLLLVRENIMGLKVKIYNNVFIGRFSKDTLSNNESNVRFKDRLRTGLNTNKLPIVEDLQILRLKAEL